MNKIKLVIEMPENDYLWIKNHVMTVNEQIIANGKLLGEILGDIRADIIKMRSEHNCSCSDCLDIIDKYRSEADCRECKAEYECYECENYKENEE